MSNSVKKIIIVGGGTAGWLTAGLLAAEHRQDHESAVRVVLVESPDVKAIGVGEGTWPTMRSSLETIGLAESDFIRGCESSFKQGTRFNGWSAGGTDYYYHPFALPPRFHEVDLATGQGVPICIDDRDIHGQAPRRYDHKVRLVTRQVMGLVIQLRAIRQMRCIGNT